MNFQKLLTLLLCVGVVSTLAACGGGGSAPQGGESPASPAESPASPQ